MFENAWIPGLGAETNLKLLEKKTKQLHQLFDYNHILFKMQTRKGERETVYLARKTKPDPLIMITRMRRKRISNGLAMD